MRKANLTLAALSVLEAVAAVVMARSLGFPDGHLTELDRFHTVSLPVTAAAFVTLAIAVTRLRLKPALALYVALNVVALAIDLVAAQRLESGSGG